MVEATPELRRDISRVIRQVRPERVVTQSPERNWDFIFASHPDHLAAGEAAVCAVYPDARNPFAHPELLDDEGLEPWSVSELWIMGPRERGAAIAVDTTATVQRKVAALMCHKSQIGDPEGITERVLAMSRAQGEVADLPGGSRPSSSGSPASPEPAMGAGEDWVVMQHVAFEGPGSVARAVTDAGAGLRVVRSTGARRSRRPPRSGTWRGSSSWGARWASTTSSAGSTRSGCCCEPPWGPAFPCSASASVRSSSPPPSVPRCGAVRPPSSGSARCT